MPRLIFFLSLVLCLLAIALSQLPDPGIFGLGDASGRILFYGGSGLLAGLFGLVALISAFFWNASAATKSGYLVAVLVLLAAVIGTVLIFRFG